jgi:hypothetical protein
VRESEAEKRPQNKSRVLFQLAICKKIGFGTNPDLNAAQEYLIAAEQIRQGAAGQTIPPYTEARLDAEIAKTHGIKQSKSKLLRRLYDTGTIQTINQGLEFQRSTSPESRIQIGKDRQREITTMEAVLGSTHPAVLNLKWSFYRFLIDDPSDILAPVEFLHDLVKSLEARPVADNGHHRKQQQEALVIAKAYRAYSLLRIKQPQIRDAGLAEAQSVDQALTEVGLGEHVAAFMVCISLADHFSAYGYYERAREFLERGKQIVAPKFGPEHPFSLAVAEKETEIRLRNVGGTTVNNIIEEQTNILRLRLQVMDANSIPILSLRKSLAVAHLSKRNYQGALDMINGTAGLLKDSKKAHVLDPDVVMPAIYAAMMTEKYDQAIPSLKIIIADLDKIAWPPPPAGNSSRRSHGFYIDASQSKFMTELLARHDKVATLPRQYPDPTRFTMDPEHMVQMSNLVVCLQSQAEFESSRNPSSSRATKKEADAYLKRLLGQIQASLNLTDSTLSTLNKTLGKNHGHNPLIRAALDNEHTPLVEILTSLGYRGFHNGIHYKTAIAAATKEGMFLFAGILAEHYNLCSHADDINPNDPPMFSSVRDLVISITGQWKGAALYAQAGSRKDPKANLTMELQVSSDPHSEEKDANGKLTVTGTCMNGEDGVDGQYCVRGTVDMVGNVFLRMSHKDSKQFAEAVKKGGRISRQQQAMGGFFDLDYSHPGVLPLSAGGTWFLYKS